MKVKRLRTGDIISEYIHSDSSNRALIVLEGLPSVPDEKLILQTFAEKGYSVFYPRYKGTWESEGEFLRENPVADVEELIDALIGGIELNGSKVTFSEIYVLSSSFGGAVALTLKDRTEIRKIVALSPVFNFSAISSLSTLSPFIRKFYASAYRYSDIDWDRLLKGELINPAFGMQRFDDKSKITVFAGEDDPEIEISQLERFCMEFALALRRFKNVGHISYSKVTGEVLKSLLEIL